MLAALLRCISEALLPRHRDARRARSTSLTDLASRAQPRLLPGALWIHTLLPYHDAAVRACIKAVKYYGEQGVATVLGTFAADYLVDYLADESALGGMEGFVIVPIPSSPTRLRTRGYNQVARIAVPLAAHASLPYAEALIRAERASQVHVARHLRTKNIANAFSVPRPELVRGKRVILIDDVVESGATLKDAKRALLESGARSVIALAIAH